MTMRVVQVVLVIGLVGGVAAAGVGLNPDVHAGGLDPDVDELSTVEELGLGEGGVAGMVENHHCPWHRSTMLKLLKITRALTNLQMGMIT